MNLFPSTSEKEEKSKKQLQYLATMILVGMGYYFWWLYTILNQKLFIYVKV